MTEVPAAAAHYPGLLEPPPQPAAVAAYPGMLIAEVDGSLTLTLTLSLSLTLTLTRCASPSSSR